MSHYLGVVGCLTVFLGSLEGSMGFWPGCTQNRSLEELGGDGLGFRVSFLVHPFVGLARRVQIDTVKA